ncbi:MULTISPECIES: GIY-YIG nuclease family protein [unclassified Xanthobacter]|uniref:GIY-YIG nuclease family protein n=1 Tax=unclassified Xanthobacter TaxID=2623496 RepID=UPI001F275AF5|nr:MULTISPECIES: GIY-YIG nuclease family protein [unclassified Xanthobacter]
MPVPDTTRQWCTYLIECGDGSIYCGVSNDVERRMHDHGTARGARYVRSHGGVRRLLRAIGMSSKEEAMRVEYRLKRASRRVKEAIATTGHVPVNWLRTSSN